jgi:hypothetical protein
MYIHARNVIEHFLYSSFLFSMNVTIQGKGITDALIAIKSSTPMETYTNMRLCTGRISRFLV